MSSLRTTCSRARRLSSFRAATLLPSTRSKEAGWITEDGTQNEVMKRTCGYFKQEACHLRHSQCYAESDAGNALPLKIFGTCMGS
ncbi:unnamed protein product [Closterium sp. NIES-53]